MFWFEYNFLFVLSAGGRADKGSLGDHTAAGYRQRARFYAISEEGRLRFAKNIASYLLFLAENTGLAPAPRVAVLREKLEFTATLEEFLNSIDSGYRRCTAIDGENAILTQETHESRRAGG